MSDAHFERVRTDAGFHYRVRGRNGRILASSEVYRSATASLNGIRALAEMFSVGGRVWITPARSVSDQGRRGWVSIALDEEPFGAKLAVRLEYVDERTTS